jgi:hypothetical protein
MSGLKFYSYEGMGQHLLRDLGYSQAVRVGDRIEVCGQGERNKTPWYGLDSNVIFVTRWMAQLS